MVSLAISILAIPIGVKKANAVTVINVTVDNDEYDSDTDCSTNPSDCSLREAIAYANNVSTTETEIVLPHANYTLSLEYLAYPEGPEDLMPNTQDLDIISSYPVTITGTHISGATIDADGIDRVITTTTELTLDSVSLVNGLTSGNGGGIYSTDTLSLENASIEENIGAIGGGIYSTDTLNIVDSTIYNNLAFSTAIGYGDGGGVYSTSTLDIQGSTINYNDGHNGGGVYSEGPLSVDSSYITYNNAVNTTTGSGNGGGVYSKLNSSATNSTVLIDNSYINNNSAYRDGGAVFLIDQDLVITYSELNNNVAGNGSSGGDGGAIHIDASSEIPSIDLSDSTVSSNDADGDGGGIYVEETGLLTIDSSDITYNSANGYLFGGSGGGLYGDKVYLDDVLISNNDSAYSGGGLYAGDTLLMLNSRVRYNVTSEGGGGIRTIGASDVTINHSYIYDNEAGFGAGASIDGGDVDIINTDIYDNYTSSNSMIDNHGGGIYFTPTTTLDVIMNNVTILNNTAVEDGGGVYVDSDVDELTLELVNSSVRVNDAGNGGGLYVSPSVTSSKSFVVDVSATDFIGNVADHGAGIYYAGDLSNSDSLSIEQIDLKNNVSVTGGGMFIESGDVTVFETEFLNNYASGLDAEGHIDFLNPWAGASGAGIFVQKADTTAAQVLIDSSLFVSNVSEYDAAGVYNGIGNDMSIINSTFNGNLASNSISGGSPFSYYGGAIYNNGDLDLSNSTLAFNKSYTAAGGLYSGIYATSTNVKSTIVARNVSGYPFTSNCGASSSGAGITSYGYNLSDDATCNFTSTGDQMSTLPGFVPVGLADNGGATRTIALGRFSAANRAGSCTDISGNSVTVDQRGFLRPRPIATVCDAGAFEASW